MSRADGLTPISNLMTVGDIRKMLEGLPDDMAVHDATKKMRLGFGARVCKVGRVDPKAPARFPGLGPDCVTLDNNIPWPMKKFEAVYDALVVG